MIRKIFYLVAIAGFVLVMSCSRDKSPLRPDPADGNPVHIITDWQNFDRAAAEGTPCAIDSAFLRDDLLYLYVAYSGGCEKHTFTLYCTRGIYYSNPPQADVYLGHDGHGDTCEAYLHEQVIFDLSPLLPEYHNGLGLRLHRFGEVEPFITLWWKR